MAEQWFVRVEGREFGPVDLEELLEWKAEGRVIRDNEVRRASERWWHSAGDIPEIFAQPPPLPLLGIDRQRPLTAIVAETFRIYRAGFGQFVALAAMVAVPSYLLQLTFSRDASFGASALSLALLVVTLCAFPFSIAGMQVAADEIARGRKLSMGDLVRRARALWARVAGTAAIVYGSYLFWIGVPLLAAYSVVSAGATTGGLLLALLILLFVAWMVARLFINFLFWEPVAALGDAAGVDAVRQSKELARSRGEAPWHERPLYRGAVIASVWLLAVLVLTTAAETPFVAMRLRGVTTPQEILATAQQLANSKTPDALMILGSIASSIVHLLLRPLLAIAFVLLYYDAKAQRQEDAAPRS